VQLQSLAVWLLGAATAGASVDAQSLAQRVVSSDGRVDVIYPSRPAACGDGERYVSNVLGHSTRSTIGTTWSNGVRSDEPCVHGPARAAVTVADGQVTRIAAYVGPEPATRADVRVIHATSSEATVWLSGIVEEGTARAASDAIVPLVLADASDPWRLLLRVARDAGRPRPLRSSALFWLSDAAIDHLGIVDADDQSDADQMRAQAVFVLSQRPRGESVPELADLALHAKYPAARRAAIFWLGQTGTDRAADVYAELLDLR
jgi:hypothetical protein